MEPRPEEKTLVFVIDGPPEAWKRAGYFQHSKGLTIYDPQSKEKKLTKAQLAKQYSGDPITTPVRINLLFELPIPTSREKELSSGLVPYSKKPDIDNLQKYIFDCMNGQILHDDAQIYQVEAKKIFSQTPRTMMTIHYESV